MDVGRQGSVLGQRARDVLLLELHVVEVAQQPGRRAAEARPVRLQVHVVGFLLRERLEEDGDALARDVGGELSKRLGEEAVLDLVGRGERGRLGKLAGAERRDLDHARRPEGAGHGDPLPVELDRGLPFRGHGREELERAHDRAHGEVADLLPDRLDRFVQELGAELDPVITQRAEDGGPISEVPGRGRRPDAEPDGGSPALARRAGGERQRRGPQEGAARNRVHCYPRMARAARTSAAASSAVPIVIRR
jgi:hypothetical protein